MRRLLLALSVALTISACRPPATTSAPPPTTSQAPATTQAPTTTTLGADTTTHGAPSAPPEAPEATPDPETHEVLRADGEVPVFPHPLATAPSRLLPASTVLGTPTVLPVRERRTDGWARVSLPGRPNGAQGWVRPDGLASFHVTRRVEVDLDDRRLVVLEDGEEIYSTTVAVGSSASPTPTGSFFITDAVALRDGSGPWGPFAFGLSARSDTITEFKGADGIIGIHGTNDPGSIGHAASLGCVRVRNDVIGELWELLSVGVPVTVEA